jgi:hypothetical protein
MRNTEIQTRGGSILAMAMADHRLQEEDHGPREGPGIARSLANIQYPDGAHYNIAVTITRTKDPETDREMWPTDAEKADEVKPPDGQ